MNVITYLVNKCYDVITVTILGNNENTIPKRNRTRTSYNLWICEEAIEQNGKPAAYNGIGDSVSNLTVS